MRWLLLSMGASACVLQQLVVATAYAHANTNTNTHVHQPGTSTTRRPLRSSWDRRGARSYMISSALENLVSSVQSNALLSDCITVCLSTAFSDLVAQNTEEGQKMLAGENSEKGTSKHVNCFSFLSQAHTFLLHMRMFVCLYVCMCAYVYIYICMCQWLLSVFQTTWRDWKDSLSLGSSMGL